MTLKIREEYKIHKDASDTLISEAAIRWVEENVVLINEKLTYKQIEVLQNKFIKFDDVFGKVKDKLPTLVQLIDSAEQELNAVTAGRSSEISAKEMLKKLGYIYNTLSVFFSKDVKALLNAPMLRGAKENPDVKLNVLQANKHDPSMIRDAFMDRLNPSKEEIKLFNKIYKGNLPQLDTVSIANQMLNLSYNELVELSNIGKVPMITTNDLTTAPASPAEQPPVEPAAPAPIAETTVEPEKAPIQSIVAPQVMKPMGTWGGSLKEGTDFLTEIMDSNKLNKLVTSINNLMDAANIKGLERLSTPMKQLVTQAKQELGNNTFSEGKAVKQLIMFYNVLERIRDQWPLIKQLFTDPTFDETEANSLKAILTKTAKDPFFSGLAKKLTTDHYPGLDPVRVATELTNAARQDGGVEAVTNFFDTMQKLPNADRNGEIVGASAPKASLPSQPPAAAAIAEPTAVSSAPASPILGPDGKPVSAAGTAASPIAPSEPGQKIDPTVAIQNALNLNPKQAKKYVDALNAAGLTISKK